MSSGFGFVALMGVAVQTSVNLHSFINKLRLEGKDIASATHEASLLRLRPIMMTALVACLGLLPAAMSTGIGSDSQKPFAIVIVGGHGVDIACFAMLVHFIGEYARSRHRV